MDLASLARDERTDLAAFLSTLTPEQWEAPTLCEGWRVRDVVAHMLSYDELGLGDLVRSFAKGLFMVNRANAVALSAYNTRTPAELIELVRNNLEPHGLPAAFGGMIALVDGVIHHQDIRRPLNLPREIPAERLVATLQGALKAPIIRGFWRVRGVRLVATDLDWAAGRGPEVRGPGESLLMTIAGRRGVLGELSGPGLTKLEQRFKG